MNHPLFIALEEQLEIEKLDVLEDQAAKTGNDEVLYDNLKKLEAAADLKADADAKADEEDSDSDVSGDDPSTPPDEAPDAASNEEVLDAATVAGANEDDGLKVAQEELRNLTYSLEEYGDYTGQSAAGTQGFVGVATSAFMAAVGALTTLGIQYGPSVVKSLYKGVIYVFGKLAKLLYVSTVTLTKYIERRNKSFSNLKESLSSLKKSVELLKQDKGNLDGQQFTDQKVINSLKIGQSTDFAANIGKLKNFLNVAVSGLNRQIGNDIGAINHIMAYSKAGSTKLPENILTVKPLITNMVQGSVEGYQNYQELTESYKYNEVLPSDVVLIAVLPKGDLGSMELYTKAYSESKLFLGIDMTSFTEVRNVDYMTLEVLSAFIGELDKLCDECIAHQSLYEKISVSKKHLKFGFKNYFTSLASADTKVSIRGSLVEYVYLKSMFIDKVYLTAAMDIHDYAAKVILFGISYVEDHVKKLS